MPAVRSRVDPDGGALAGWFDARMPVTRTRNEARPGDWIEAQGLPGRPSRRGQIVEILGAPGHERYLVRWDEQHESICYPTDGVLLLSRKAVLSGSA